MQYEIWGKGWVRDAEKERRLYLVVGMRCGGAELGWCGGIKVVGREGDR